MHLSFCSFYTSKIFLKCLNDLILRIGFTKKWGKFPVYYFIKFWAEIFFHQTISNFQRVNSVFKRLNLKIICYIQHTLSVIEMLEVILSYSFVPMSSKFMKLTAYHNSAERKKEISHFENFF